MIFVSDVSSVSPEVACGKPLTKCVDAESHREILFGFASDRTRIDCHAAWHAR